MTLKHSFFCIASISFLFLPGCFIPVNLQFDSAKMNGKNTTDVQASGSAYTDGDGTTTLNGGVRIGYGATDRWDLRLRAEYSDQSITTTVHYSGSSGSGTTTYHDQNAFVFLQLENKFRIREDRIAFSLPIGFYAGLGFVQVDPNFIFTPVLRPHFDYSIIAKAQLFTDGTDASFLPGVCMDFGASKDFSKWAVRGEIGFDMYFSAGIAFSYKFQHRNKSTAAE